MPKVRPRAIIAHNVNGHFLITGSSSCLHVSSLKRCPVNSSVAALLHVQGELDNKLTIANVTNPNHKTLIAIVSKGNSFLVAVQHVHMDAVISATSGMRHANTIGIFRLLVKPMAVQSTVNNMDDTEMAKAAIPVLECCFISLSQPNVSC
jgi:hypothetical protein